MVLWLGFFLLAAFKPCEGLARVLADPPAQAQQHDHHPCTNTHAEPDGDCCEPAACAHCDAPDTATGNDHSQVKPLPLAALPVDLPFLAQPLWRMIAPLEPAILSPPVFSPYPSSRLLI